MADTLTPGAATSDAEPSLAEAFSGIGEALIAAEEGLVTDETATQSTPGAPNDPASTAAADPAATQQDPTATEQQPPSEDTAEGADQGDLMANAKPLEYTVDGVTRTFDGAHFIPGMGAIVDLDALPKLQDRLQQADRLVETNKQLYQNTQEYQRFGGRDGVEKLVAERAMLDRAATILLTALQNEEQLLTLATDPVARQHLLRELDLSGREAQNQARAHLSEHARSVTQAETQASQATTAITNATAELAKAFPGLTTEDLAAVRTHAGRVQAAIIRPATADEARSAGVRPGDMIIDLPTLHMLLADRHELRKQATAVAASKAATDKTNAARLAAANPTAGRGAPGAPRPGAGKAPPPQKTLDTMSSAEITRAMKTGRIFDLIGGDDQ